MSSYDALKIITKQTDAAVVVYNNIEVICSFFDDTKNELIPATNSIFYIAKPEKQYIFVSKASESSVSSITISFCSPFLSRADVGVICSDPYHLFTISAFSGLSNTNITFKQNTRMAVFMASPFLRFVNIETLNPPSATDYFNNNGEFSQNEGIQASYHAHCIFIIFKIGEIRSSMFFKVKPTTTEAENSNFVYKAAFINKFTNVMEEIYYDPKNYSNKVCLCLKANNCSLCPKDFIASNNIEANNLFAKYIGDKNGPDLYLYVTGTGSAYFSMSGYESANLHLTCSDTSSLLDPDFFFSSLGLFNVTNAALDFSKKEIQFDFQIERGIFMNSYIKSGTTLPTLQCTYLEADPNSIGKLYQIKVTRRMNLIGDFNNQGTCVQGGVYMNYNGKFTVTKQQSKIAIGPNLILIDCAGMNVYCRSITFQVDKLSVSNIASDGSYSIFLKDAELETTGENISPNVVFNLDGLIKLAVNGPLPKISTTITTVLDLDTESFLKHGVDVNMSFGSFIVDTKDFINRIEFSNSNQKFSSGSDSFSIISTSAVVVKNNNKNSISLFPPTDLVNYRFYEIHLGSGSTTILERGWSSLSSKILIKFVPKDKNFKILTRDSSIPESMFTWESSASSSSVVPFPTPTKDMRGPIAGSVIGCLVFVCLIICVILLTPVGNWIGLTTYGPLGKVHKDYGFDDDDDAGMEIDSSEDSF